MKVIFVFAHPDDETFSSGGTIALLTKNGTTVNLITATRGEKGMFGNPPVANSENIGKVREKELRNAAKILGISKIYFFDYIDSFLPKVPEKQLTDRILKIFKSEKPDVVVTFNEEGGSKHPDHIYIGRCATLAFNEYIKSAKKHVRLYHTAMPRSVVVQLERKGMAYTAFGRIFGTPDELITTRVDISKTVSKKIKALKCHRTQNGDWEKFLKRRDNEFFNRENFRLVSENKI